MPKNKLQGFAFSNQNNPTEELMRTENIYLLFSLSGTREKKTPM